MNFSALSQRSLRLWWGSSPTVKEGSHAVSSTKDDEPSLTVGLLPRYREVVLTTSKLVLRLSHHISIRFAAGPTTNSA